MTTLCFDLAKTLIHPALSMAGLQQPGMAEMLEAVASAEHLRPGPDRHGPFGMTAWVHRRVWDHYIVRSPDLACRIRGLASQREFLGDPHRELDMNWGYATALAALNCLYHSRNQLPDGHQPRMAVALWRRAFHRGHQVDDRCFLRAYQSAHDRADDRAA